MNTSKAFFSEIAQYGLEQLLLQFSFLEFLNKWTHYKQENLCFLT